MTITNAVVDLIRDEDYKRSRRQSNRTERLPLDYKAMAAAGSFMECGAVEIDLSIRSFSSSSSCSIQSVGNSCKYFSINSRPAE